MIGYNMTNEEGESVEMNRDEVRLEIIQTLEQAAADLKADRNMALFIAVDYPTGDCITALMTAHDDKIHDVENEIMNAASRIMAMKLKGFAESNNSSPLVFIFTVAVGIEVVPELTCK